ncbi:RNase H domain-containing protein [Trichonephila clavipes]|nr:RNase H domain-containing protein [Trichonephila clavipes]
MGKSYILQWILVHIDIEGEQLADSLAKETRIIEPVPLSTTVFDANAVAKQKLCTKPRKKCCLPELKYNRQITTTITRVRAKNFKDMKILYDGSRTYVEGTQMYPKHF